MINKLFYLFFFMCGTLVMGQNYSFRHLQVEDGLSHSSVICMLQDNKGFMWFGTKDGLNRYDGYSFKIFQHVEGDPKSIGSNFIRCMYESKDNLWIGTDTGLFKYNELSESFSLVEVTRNQPILDVKCGKDGSLWFSAAGSLYKINDRDERIKPEKFSQFFVSNICINSKGEVFTSSSNELFKYVPENNSFKRLQLNFGKNVPTLITTIAADDNKGILIGTKDYGAFSYSFINQKLTTLLQVSENPLFVRNFLKKNKDELWIGSESGIFVYNLKTHTYHNLKKNYGNPYSLSDNAIYCQVLDKEGGVWSGTYFGGVNYYPNPYTPINRYFPQIGENSISGNAVREIKKDMYGNMWIGTEDAGLNKLNPATGKFVNYTVGSLSHYNIHGLMPRGNELWIGTFEHGLDVMDIPTGKVIRHYGTKKGGLRNDFVFYIYETKNHDIYVLTAAGIHKYLPETDCFKLIDGFPEAYLYTYLIEDNKGVLWAGTYWDGLYYFNPKTKKKGFYRYEHNNPGSLSSNVINGIFEDSRKRLWITTENGLNLFNPATQSFTKYTKASGLPANVIYSIMEDKKRELWIGTSNGLVNFNPDSKSIKRIFTTSDGLLSDQFNYCSAFQDTNGDMYFGSVKGMISFNPDKFTKSTFNPPLYITDIFINNKDVPVGKKDSPLQQSIIFSKHITLNSHQSTFKLEFASLGYASTGMTQYWYKIEGLNDNWMPLGKNHEVNFTELPAGDYVFKVKSLNSYGGWNKEYGVLDITILPPFYASRAAYAIYFVLLLVVGYYLFMYYHHYTKNKSNLRISKLENEKDREIYNAKIEFFTNIAHEIRTPLTLIKIPLEKLIKQKYNSPDIPKNLGIMERNTTRLLNLVNELLDFRKAEMRNMKLSFVAVNVSQVLRETYISFSQLIQDKGLQFEMNESAHDLIAFVDEEALRKILSNLFSNAIKYSVNTVQVSLSLDESNFTIVVKNDGLLIPANLRKKIFEPFFRLPSDAQSSGTGIGLSLAHSLAELHSGILEIDTKETDMNAFVLTLPLHQDEEFTAIKMQAPADGVPRSTSGKFHKKAPVILLAEDNEDLADFIFTELAESYNVILTKDGDEAWRMINEHDVQLVVSDVMMPGKNGIELCREIKKTERTSHIPVILLTAKSALNAKIEGLESGADAYITKPFSIDHLIVQIFNLIENRKNILEHFSSSPLAHLKSLITSNTDKTFLAKLDKVIEDNLKDHDLNVDKLADYLNISRSTLYRSIKEITHLSPNELINLSRLKKGAQLIKTTNMKIYEVAEMVGYKSQTSFGRNFQKHFGMTPTEFEKTSEPEAKTNEKQL